jgi:hypothetical protein
LQRAAVTVTGTSTVRAGCRRLLALSAAFGLAGCAALIMGSGPEEREIIHAGSTEAQLIERLGPPIRVQKMAPAQRAWDLREQDNQVSLLVHPSYGFDVDKGSTAIPPPDMAVSAAIFRYSGKIGKDPRAGQAGFDSMMTLGLAEIYLIPKALWQRATDEPLQLTVWFDDAGHALAYKWAVLQRQ